MNTSYPYDADLHEAGSEAARGGCSYHQEHHDTGGGGCAGEAVVSYQDRQGHWQSGCSAARERLVADGEIEPLGQGA
jgi:hypothetical protein